ncbi:TetR/AcrR family transcriptional regulator [Burkholderia seminalis]|uniref:TetR/AcrR family transcriptional regulator n=2 Tax=Burkholderia cepacia complex TaxID=87882 RepID=A0A8A8DFF3_9BURK|nr:TetR/AcrR family transcriptional regulator [Burkholderia seminalis]QTO23342.1 TetR/AcrR family transcriptional regulator [Burkholderia seminalis]
MGEDDSVEPIGSEVVIRAEGGARQARRPPTQSRGRARVEAILDAAGAIVAAEGLAGLTMHGIARRAQTSIGSLYHFFPDRNSVVQALVDRHEAGIREINDELAKVSREVWRSLSAADAIARLMMPYVEYLRRHKDFFPLMHDRQPDANAAGFIQGVGRILDARLPKTRPAVRGRYAAMLHAIAAGTLNIAFVQDPGRLPLYLNEVVRVMSAYLADIECSSNKSLS